MQYTSPRRWTRRSDPTDLTVVIHRPRCSAIDWIVDLGATVETTPVLGKQRASPPGRISGVKHVLCRVVSVFTTIVLASGCGLSVPGSRSVDPQTEVFTGQITTSGQRCLDASESDGRVVEASLCNGRQTQQWTLGSDGSVRSGQHCLTSRSDPPTEGTALTVADCTSVATHRRVTGDSNTFTLVSTPLCAAVIPDESRKVGLIALAECDGSSGQVWSVVEAPAPTADNPSGVAAPQGDLPSWRQIFVDEFTEPSVTGSWANDCDPAKIVYTGSEGQRWRTYPLCYPDTYDKRPYRPDAVLSTADGALNYHLHRVDGIPAGASISPLVDGDSQYQTYGRYTARFKVDTADLDEYYVAWLLWPASENWPYDGEFDFPEGTLSGNVGGYHHYAGAGSCADGCKVPAMDIGAQFTDWHTYTMEWTPDRIRYLLDEVEVLSSTDFVPSGPMRWELQTETKGSGSHDGNLILDWVAVYSWAG